MKDVVVNKLVLGNDLLGYRFDILENGSKLVSLDVAKEYSNIMIKMIGKEKITRGVVIRGKEVNGLFVTNDEAGTIEVKSKAQADAVLNKYFFSSDSEINAMLDGIDSTREELIANSINGETMTLHDTEFGMYKKPKEEYKRILNACKDMKRNVYVEEVQDKRNGELIISVHVTKLEELLKIYYRFGKLKGYGVTKLGVMVYGKGDKTLTLNFGDTFENFLKSAKCLDIKDDFGADDGNGVICSLSENSYSFRYSIDIPGYQRSKYEDTDELLEEYDLV